MSDSPLRADAVRGSLAVAGLEARRIWREPVTWLAAILLPVVVASLVALALGGMERYRSRLAVVDLADDAVSRAFREEVLAVPRVRDAVAVVEADDVAGARRLLADGAVDGAIVLPRGLAQQWSAGRGLGIEVLRRSDSLQAVAVADLLVQQFTVRARATAGGIDAARDWPVEVSVELLDGERVDAARHYGPSVALFFALAGTGFVAARVVSDRARGISARVGVTHTPVGVLTAGRAIASAVEVAGSMLVIAAVMGVVFGRSWGAWSDVVPIAAAAGLVSALIGAALAAVVRTALQAHLLALGVAFVFAALSGTFDPPGSGVRSSLAPLAPTSFLLDATHAATVGLGHAAVLVPVAGALASAAAWASAVLAFRRLAS